MKRRVMIGGVFKGGTLILPVSTGEYGGTQCACLITGDGKYLWFGDKEVHYEVIAGETVTFYNGHYAGARLKLDGEMIINGGCYKRVEYTIKDHIPVLELERDSAAICP